MLLIVVVAVTISRNGVARICIQTHSIWVHVVGGKAMHLLVIGPQTRRIFVNLLIFASLAVAVRAFTDNEHGLCWSHHIYHLR